MALVPTDWQQIVPFFRDGLHKAILDTVTTLRVNHTIYPPQDLVFNALKLTPFEKVKVVIVGQDPYHGSGQAHGLSFSVPEGAKFPPSLRNIFKEIAAEFGTTWEGKSTDLTPWAEQGVLLLNTTLTVQEGKAASHAKLGWQKLTDDIIRTVSDNQKDIVFLLWGSHAHAKAELVDGDKHLILKAVHPSPLSASRGFFGCNHFVKANEWLEEKGKTPIVW